MLKRLPGQVPGLVTSVSQGVPGVLAAGGYGPGDALHQLKEPVDVTVDATGGLIVADLGNARVVRWAAPQVPAELLQVLRG